MEIKVTEKINQDYFNPQNKLIPRIDSPDSGVLHEILNESRTPIIFSGKFDHWKARSWTFSSLKSAFGDKLITAEVDTPEDGIKYYWDAKRYVREMTFSDFINRIELHPELQCYLPQAATNRFPGIEADFDFTDLVDTANYPPVTAIWLGTAGTRSGLHYDKRDNFLAQIIGRKKVLLASPEQAQFLYPFKDMIEKSMVNPIAPDLKEYPRFSQSVMWTGEVNSGDILYIPKTWWHYLSSQDSSMSLNYWFGPEASYTDLFRVVSAGGMGHWATLIRDFTIFGLLGRPSNRRMRSDGNTGELLYSVLRQGLLRRIKKLM